jgi:ankyrin repeat protein
VTKDLSAGEDVNEKDENGGTPLQVATYEGHKEKSPNYSSPMVLM